MLSLAGQPDVVLEGALQNRLVEPQGDVLDGVHQNGPVGRDSADAVDHQDDFRTRTEHDGVFLAACVGKLVGYVYAVLIKRFLAVEEGAVGLPYILQVHLRAVGA